MTTTLTGLRTNAQYHLGNLIGAVEPLIALQRSQHSSDLLYLFLPDLHSIESDNTLTNTQNTILNTRYLLASGIDPTNPNTRLFRQSRVPAHTQLAWIFNWFVHMGEASRMTQYKDKSAVKGESIPVSLFTYPILQAADILLYDAEYIPVGADQQQHLELARDIAIRFNNKYGTVFTIPKPWAEQLAFTSRKEGSKIMSLSSPHQKMSKSDPSDSGTIWLSDSVEIIQKKVSSATTDSIGIIDYSLNQPGISNLLTILAIMSNTPLEVIIDEWSGKERYGDLKKIVADSIIHRIGDIQARLTDYSDDFVSTMLEKNEREVNIIANAKLHQVYTTLGLI